MIGLYGSGWESNPPWNATRPNTDFEDQEAHQDLATPTRKDTLVFSFRKSVLFTGCTTGIPKKTIRAIRILNLAYSGFQEGLLTFTQQRQHVIQRQRQRGFKNARL
jgi:hypothetical protein